MSEYSKCKFRYNNETHEILFFNASISSSYQVQAPCKLMIYDKTNYSGGQLDKILMYENSGECAQIFRFGGDSLQITYYGNTSSPTLVCYKNNKKYYALKPFPNETVYVKTAISGNITFYSDENKSESFKQYYSGNPVDKDASVGTFPNFDKFSVAINYNTHIAYWCRFADGSSDLYLPGTDVTNKILQSIHSGGKGDLYLVKVRKYTEFSGSINSTSYSKSKLSTGSSGYYGATVRITWSASVKEEGANSSSVELSYSITNQGLSYKETKSGTWSASSASSGNIATLLIDANGGNSTADVTIVFYLYDTKNSATLATASLTIPDPWYFNDSSGSGGNTNPGE